VTGRSQRTVTWPGDPTPPVIDRQVVQSPYRIAIMAGCLRQTHSLFSPSPLAGDLRFSDLHGANCGLLWEQGFTHVCQRFARARSTVVLLPPQSFLRHARRELGVTWCGVGPRVGSERGALGHTAEASASLAPAPAHVHDRWAGSSGAASLTARGHARHHASQQRLRCDGLRHKASWWTTCRGSSMACKGSGVQIPSAPPGTTHRQDSRSGPSVSRLSADHARWRSYHSECYPIRESPTSRPGSS
jgi:hypothetical protein